MDVTAAGDLNLSTADSVARIKGYAVETVIEFLPAGIGAIRQAVAHGRETRRS